MKPQLTVGPKIVLLAAVTVMAALQPAHSQDIEYHPLASGKPETLLSGVNIVHGQIGQVIANYGPPSRIENRGFSARTGAKIYIWEKSGDRLDVAVGNHSDQKGRKISAGGTYAVRTQGKAPVGQIGRTGRGLSLGDPIDRVKQIYGPRAYRHKEPSDRLLTEYQWDDELFLRVYSDVEGKVVEIQLYPRGE